MGGWGTGLGPWVGSMAGAMALVACAPIPRVIDTPKDGAEITLTVKQPMRVRWSNMNPDQGAWALAEPPKSAVTLVGRARQAPDGGAVALDMFDFVGVKPGSERLTFVYVRKDGAASSAEEHITVEVKVS